ncbi:hypothetical protein DW068_17485 [Anaerobutyricum hallii]|uniref:Uncharacterized protein n=1 Tax=Anaerobutyricum hallii TaxID=39488 RepID=A0A415G2E9_9FIRM|nr:hypothetical protein DW068_17485 [Anaerobutyricum hallii]
MTWEQVLDASAKANIQHAATKVTNRDYLSSIRRLFYQSTSIFTPLLPDGSLLYEFLRRLQR